MLRASTLITLSAFVLAAPAIAGEEVVYHTIILTKGTLSITPSRYIGRSDGFVQQGSTSAAGGWSKVDGLEVSWEVPNAAAGSWPDSGMKQLEAENKMGDRQSSGPAFQGGVTVASGDVNGHSNLGASGRITVGANRTESGQATGKRQHMPLRTRMYYDEPQGSGPGSLVIRGSLPGCSVGKRYGGMQFASGNKRYELTDAVISNCGAGAVTFAYAKVKVRGWDPEKKEL
jgi:hypothetical protein